MPVALTYFAEFCPRRGRGRKVGSLLVFQLGGAVLAASLAWLLIHDRGTDRRFVHRIAMCSYLHARYSELFTHENACISTIRVS